MFLSGFKTSPLNEMQSRLLRHLLLPSTEAREQAIEMRAQLKAELEDLLGDSGLLLLPAYPAAHAPYHGEYSWKPFNYMFYTGVANSLGLPAITVPIGLGRRGAGRLPLCVQLVGAPYSERLLIAAARELEKGFGGWTPKDT
jgi:Asp-tRNA(Asn)/Glu-tRNA(Gln) amidotransferase A subunit family amidase